MQGNLTVQPEVPPRRHMGGALLVTTVLQWLGCGITLFFFWMIASAFLSQLRYLGMYGNVYLDEDFIFLSLCFIALGGWLLIKVVVLGLLAARHPRFLQVYNWGVVYGMVSSAAAIASFAYMSGGWFATAFYLAVTCCALGIPLLNAVLLTRFYLRSWNVFAYMGDGKYLGYSPLGRRYCVQA